MSFEKSSRLVTTAWIAIVGTPSWPSHANIGDVPSPFRRDVQCMLKVLHKTPRVDLVDSGVLLDNGWIHPFVQYHYQELDGRDGTVRFVAQKPNTSKDVVQYQALLNGLMTSGGPPPPAFGTGEIARQWELQCGVPAIAVFV